MELSSIGTWSEAKLDIVRKYGSAYSAILKKNPRLEHVYIDAFAGAGAHITKDSGKFVLGSPLNALQVEPPFEELHFIDIDGTKVEALKQAVGERSNVHVYQGDCNGLLLNQVFPTVRWESHRRALCLLDPYGLHLDWQVLQAAGEMRSVEIFLNFPVLDMQRNVLMNDPSKVSEERAKRMTRFWGDESWRSLVYKRHEFFDLEYKVKASASVLVSAFRERLRCVAGFQYVPEPVVMRTQEHRGQILYYLFFAGPNETGAKIATDVFKEYREPRQDSLF